MNEVVSNAEPLSIWGKGKLFLKAAVIFGMALALWIPTLFIQDLGQEREKRQKEAVMEIGSKWAGKQTVSGPFLVIPYEEVKENTTGQKFLEKKYAWFMPDHISTQAKVYPEKRHRGIYQVAVYRSDISMEVKFKPLAMQQLNISHDKLLWKQAMLMLKVGDNLKGINEELHVKWEDTSIVFDPQPVELTGIHDAFSASIPFDAEQAAKEHSCSIRFSLNGSEQLLFTASAKENQLRMESSWPNPSFTGVKLPDTRNVKDSGFIAEWKYLNRALPMIWKDSSYDLSTSVMGADLLIMVDSYDKTGRSIKYALLCIILTFASFFLIETIYRKPLHLIQYGLAGFALVLFYALLLSISEYTGFNIAYLTAGTATISLVGWYVGSVMRSSKLAIFISLVLAIVYTYIFCIIQMQDYALLMGSIGLFIALGIIMYFSRKLEW
jgi:inner membrane protein